MDKYITAGEAVTRVLKTMSLQVPVTISGSGDSTVALLWHLLGEEGTNLLDQSHEWQMLNRTFTLTTVPAQLRYALPVDFQNFIDDTGWNNTARIPLIGPMTSQQWRLLQARQLGGTTLRLQYIIERNELVFYFSPSAANSITIDYTGRGWIQNGTDPTIFTSRPVNDNDLVLYPARLITAALQNRWRIEKGFDTLASQREFDDALAAAIYNDRPKNVLGLSGRSRFPYLGYNNMPDTAYGN